MKINKLIIGLGIAAIGFTACGRDDEKQTAQNVFTNPENTRELNVPSNFNYETDREVSFNFNIQDAPPQWKVQNEHLRLRAQRAAWSNSNFFRG
jgi:hypothetical protein